MSTRLWKCYGCEETKGLDFRATEPVCPNPKCGIDGREGSKHPLRHMIVPVVVLHFHPPVSPDHLGKPGKGYLACNPTVAVGSGGFRATGDPRVVNCPGCKASPDYQPFGVEAVPNEYALPDEPPQRTFEEIAKANGDGSNLLVIRDAEISAQPAPVDGTGTVEAATTAATTAVPEK